MARECPSSGCRGDATGTRSGDASVTRLPGCLRARQAEALCASATLVVTWCVRPLRLRPARAHHLRPRREGVRAVLAAFRLYEVVGVVKAVVGLRWVERRSCLYRLFGGRTRRDGRPAAGAQFQKGRHAARRKAAPPAAGLKGWLRVSMCQIAPVSRRAMSIWATFAPRWRPRRFLVCW